MDWKMPGMDGIETSLKIRAMSELAEKPKIILVTAYSQDEALEKIKSANLDGLLIKPVSPSSLLAGETAAIPEATRRAAAERLRSAAKIGDIGGVAGLAEELAGQAPACQALSRQLVSLIDDFDLDGISQLADELEPDG
jgi:CheY-like chemotaxis protein